MRDLIETEDNALEHDARKDAPDLPSTLIRQLNQIATAQFLDAITQAGSDLTTVQHCALATLEHHSNVDQATLAGLIGYDRATTGKVVDKLCQKGLVLRTPRPGDRRAKVVSLTRNGHTLLRKLAPFVTHAQDRILAGLSADETETLLTLLKKATRTGNELSRAPRRSVERALTS